MERAHRDALRKFRVQLSDQLLVGDVIVPLLFQEGVLTHAQVEEIECARTNREKNLKLLDILPTRGPRAFHVFLQSLRDFSWLRDLLLQATPPPADAPRLPHSLLRKVPSDRDLSRLALRLGADWEAVLLDLGLTREAVFRCRADHPLSVQAAILAGLVQWRRAGGRSATVERLHRSLQATDSAPEILEEILSADP